MSIESTELILHIDNSPPGKRLYEQKKAILTNLYKKKRKGTYQAELGRKGFMHLVNAGAKDYTKVYASRDAKWHQIFTTDSRREAAAEYERRFRAEFDSYALEWLVPEKKQRHRPGNPTAKKKRTTKKKRRTKKRKTAKRGRRRVPVCPVGTEVQTLIFSKAIFTATTARLWAKKNGFKVTKVDETPDSYRLRQKDPKRFRVGTFRTISMGTAQAVIGCPAGRPNVGAVASLGAKRPAVRKKRTAKKKAAAKTARKKRLAAAKKKLAADRRKRAAERKKKAAAKKKATAKKKAAKKKRLAAAKKKLAAKKKRAATRKKRPTRKTTSTRKRTTKKRTTKKRTAKRTAKRGNPHRPGNPHFKSLSAVKSANKVYAARSGRAYWFEKDAMRFFNTRIHGKLINRKASEGSFFITSERMDERFPWKYTVRYADPSGRIDTIGAFQMFDTEKAARAAAIDKASGR